MSEKVSTLVLTVDLGCPRCNKKIKKILCKFDEIGEPKYDEKQNTVTITGHFCHEKLKKKLCRKAGDIITCIQIKEDPKHKPPPPPKDQKNGRTTPKNKPPTLATYKSNGGQTDDSRPPPPKPAPAPPPPPPPPPPLTSPVAILIGVCCIHCSKGHGGGPCYPPQCCQGLKRPPPPCYCDYETPPCYCGCGGTKGYGSTCKFYIEEDPAPCVIM